MNRFKEAREMAGIKSLDAAKEITEVSKNTIWKLGHGEVDAGYKQVIKIANAYNVNVAWLIGQPNTSPSLDVDIQKISSVTGLSEKAIKNLKTIKEEELTDCLNKILESKDAIEVLDWFETARILNQKPEETQESIRLDRKVYRNMIKDTDGNASQYTWFSDKDQIGMSLWQASQTLGRIFRQILKGDKDNGKRN